MIKNKPSDYTLAKKKQHELYISYIANKVNKSMIWHRIVEIEKHRK